MLERPAVAVPVLFGVRVGLANLGLWTAILTPALVTLALRVAEIDPVNKETSLALVAGAGAFVALIANPLFGRLSDRTTGPFGRRRPWLLLGALGGGAGLVIVALAPSITAILLGWCLTQLSFNAALAALTATIPDVVPSDSRGAVSGWVGFSQLLAVVIGAAVLTRVPVLALQILLPAVLGVVLIVAFALTFPDRPAAARSPFSLKEFVGSFWTNPRTNPDFGWAWLTRFLVVFGAFGPTTYEAFFLSDRIGIAKEDAAAKLGILLLVTSVISAGTALLGGWLSDRIGRRKPFVIVAALLMALGMVLFMIATTYPGVLLAHVVSGLGTGMFYAVDLALVTLVLPEGESAGKDLGVFNIANALPQFIGPAVAPMLLAIGGGKNYSALYGFAGISVLVGAILVTRIKSVR